MNNSQSPTMFDWLFKPDSLPDKLIHAGFGGFVLAALAKDVLKGVTPSSGTTTVVCIAFALLLVICSVRYDPQDSRLRWPIRVLAIAYVWMATLYFLNWSSSWSHPWINTENAKSFYDAFTDLASSLFFAGAWMMLSSYERDKARRTVDFVAVAVLCVLLFMAGAWKLVIEIGKGRNTPEYEAVRLLLNLANGAVFLGLYGLIRRLLPPPDPVSHLFILLYGCVQVAAHGRDCLGSGVPCEIPAPEAIVAYAISWLLLLGKIGFGTYLCYLYFNGRIRPENPVPAVEGAGGPIAADEAEDAG